MFWLLQEVEGSADAVRDVVQAQPAPPQHLQDFLAKAAWYEGQKFSLTPQGSFMPAHVELAPRCEVQPPLLSLAHCIAEIPSTTFGDVSVELTMAYAAACCPH